MIRVGLDSEIGELNEPWAKYLTVDRNSIIRSGYQIIYSNKNIVFNYFFEDDKGTTTVYRIDNK